MNGRKKVVREEKEGERREKRGKKTEEGRNWRRGKKRKPHALSPFLLFLLVWAKSILCQAVEMIDDYLF